MTRPSPFAALETTFRLLSQSPDPVAINGGRLGHGAPDRPIPISELRAIALHPAATDDLQGAILEVVISSLPLDPATWTVVLGGILLPAMQCLAGRLTVDAGERGKLRVEAELLWRLAAATRQPPAVTRQFARSLLARART
jgi:hypothetical protein